MINEPSKVLIANPRVHDVTISTTTTTSHPSTPTVDAMLPDGSRLRVVIPASLGCTGR